MGIFPNDMKVSVSAPLIRHFVIVKTPRDGIQSWYVGVRRFDGNRSLDRKQHEHRIRPNARNDIANAAVFSPKASLCANIAVAQCGLATNSLDKRDW